MKTHYNPLQYFETEDHPFAHKSHISYPHLDCSLCMSDSVLLREDFTNITLPKWHRICDQVHDKTGITISNLSGQASAKGLTVAWDYNSDNLRLTLSLVHRSWYDPSTDNIDTQIKAWVNAA